MVQYRVFKAGGVDEPVTIWTLNTKLESAQNIKSRFAMVIVDSRPVPKCGDRICSLINFSLEVYVQRVYGCWIGCIRYGGLRCAEWEHASVTRV